MENKILIHPWQEKGIGKAPYRCVGVYSFPSPSLAEHNPEAYNNALREAPAGYELGSCRVCGMPLTHNFLIHDAEGKRFTVGSDCVAKVNDARLMSQVDVLRREQNRQKAKIKREEKQAAERAARLAELEAQRQRNGGLTDYELEQQKLNAERESKRQQRIEILSPLATILNQQNGEFCRSIYRQFKDGDASVSGRAVDIIAKICGDEAREIIAKAKEIT